MLAGARPRRSRGINRGCPSRRTRCRFTRADARRAVVRLRVEERHFRAERLGERYGLVNGVDRQRRIVEWDQQMPIHQKTPVISTGCRR